MDNENVLHIEDLYGLDLYIKLETAYGKYPEVGVWIEDIDGLLCFISKKNWDKLNNHVQANYKKWENLNG